MASKAIFSLVISVLIATSTSLKIKIVDEDYINVVVGSEGHKMKLLIDPTAPFSYLLKTDFPTKTREETGESHEFKNIFGTFSGKWQKDFLYLTDDKEFAFKLKYLAVDKTDSVLDADGVIGLGYSKQFDQECQIYAILQGMKNVFHIRNAMSYDKAKQLLTIGEIPKNDNFNKVRFPVFEGDKSYPASFVNLTQISFSTLTPKTKSYIDANGTAKLGLMPVIIAPFSQKGFLEAQYFSQFTNTSLIKTEKDNEKFFTDFFYPETNTKKITELIFGRIAYKFAHDEEKDGRFRSAIRLGDKAHELNYWYIGVDLLGVSRADFDYDNGDVYLYSTTAYDILGSKYIILFKAILACVSTCILIATFVRCFCQKKKQSEIKQGEELLEL